MTGKPLKTINCRNRVCRKFLCRSDGVFLFVENLEVLPKLIENAATKTSIVKTILCSHCGWKNKIGLKKTSIKEVPETKPGRKFLIFRSPF